MAAGLRCIAVEQQVGKERLAARPRQAVDGHAVVFDTDVTEKTDAEAGGRSAGGSVHRYRSQSRLSNFRCCPHILAPNTARVK